MGRMMLLAILAVGLTACHQSFNDQDQPQSTANSTNFPAIRAGASPIAADTRRDGGVLAGAGGAGPGYDGSGLGTGKNGTIPTSSSGLGVGPPNSTFSTNVLSGVPIDGRPTR